MRINRIFWFEGSTLLHKVGSALARNPQCSTVDRELDLFLAPSKRPRRGYDAA